MNNFMWALWIFASIVFALSYLVWAFADLGQATAAALESVADCIQAWKRIRQSLNF